MPRQIPPDEFLLTVPELAERIKSHPDTIRALTRRKAFPLPFYLVGRRQRFVLPEVFRFLREEARRKSARAPRRRARSGAPRIRLRSRGA